MEVIESKGFDTLQAELSAFAAAARGGAPFPVPLDEVLMGVRGFEAVVQSSNVGRPVKVASQTTRRVRIIAKPKAPRA